MKRFFIIWREIIWVVLFALGGCGIFLSAMLAGIAFIVLATMLAVSFCGLKLEKTPDRLKEFWYSGKSRIVSKADGGYVKVYRISDGNKMLIKTFDADSEGVEDRAMDFVNEERGYLNAQHGNGYHQEAKRLARVLNK